MDSIRRKRNLFLSVTIMCLLFGFIFGFILQGIQGINIDAQKVFTIFMVLALFFGGLWLKNQKILKADQKSFYY